MTPPAGLNTRERDFRHAVLGQRTTCSRQPLACWRRYAQGRMRLEVVCEGPLFERAAEAAAAGVAAAECANACKSCCSRTATISRRPSRSGARPSTAAKCADACCCAGPKPSAWSRNCRFAGSISNS